MRDKAGPSACEVRNLSLPRLLQTDWLEMGSRQHNVHALLDVDIYHARKSLKSAPGGAISFSAYVVHCVAQAVSADRQIHAVRRGRNVILFDDVDIAVLVEKKIGGERIPLPFILRAANSKSPLQIHHEIREAMNAPHPPSPPPWLFELWQFVPFGLRQAVLRMLLRNPRRRKQIMGTVAVSTLSMFGNGRGWGIPLTAHTLCVTTGGIRHEDRQSESAGGTAGHADHEELISLTLSFDHDLVDGAPAARFAARLKGLLEQGL